MVILADAQPLPRRLRAASLAVAVLCVAALVYGAWDLRTLPSARSAPYLAWQRVHVWNIAAATGIYFVVTGLRSFGRGLAWPKKRYEPGPWLWFPVAGHCVLALAVGVSLWRGPRSRLLLAGHDELAAALLAVALIAGAVALWSARWTRRVQIVGIQGGRSAPIECFFALATVLVLLLLELSTIPGPGRPATRVAAPTSAVPASAAPPSHPTSASEGPAISPGAAAR
ncbi:MAG: hypothetical protein K1X74_05530 [Pirellulales bacterium]|nr:hypothetical protein [Pirellulales bacterium]